ncbi:hypothetical protein ACIGW0_31555 [Streptomyces bikiniensis]|uniref:Minor tail protein n=1 Tax=Streptomyces bikiniensis TaxID=1896 RepID=A0ABW8D1Z2_STRBI
MSVPTNLLPANTAGIETSTAGWTAGANTTLSQSTRFYQGARSLGLTATAAGSVTATTATRVAVTEGLEYQAYAYFANVAAAAGRTSFVAISWYTASSGGSPISTSTGAATTLANATTWNTPSPQVTAIAPAGATYAALTITVTGLTAGAGVVADVMTLGLPTTWPGNLLGYTVAGVETDTSGWNALALVTVDRVFTDSWEGWYSLRLTSTGAGSLRSNTVSSVTVTPGVEHVGIAMVKPTTTSDVALELRWYTAANALVSTTPLTWTAVPGGAWTRLTVIGTPPPTATRAYLALRPVATAAGETWLFDQMALMPASLLTGTLLSYGVQSMETDVSGWTAQSGCTIARSTATVFRGYSSMAISTTGAASASVRMAGTVPVTPRQAYKGSAYFYHALSAAPVVVDVTFTWYNALGAEIDTGTFRWTTSELAGWYSPTGSDVAPDGAASLRVGFKIISPGTATYYIDEVFVGPGGLGLVADVIPDVYGAEISLQGLTTGGHTHYGLWRVRDDGALTPVRGEDGDIVAVPITGDLAVASDYEAPLGTPIRYLVRVYTGDTYLRMTSRQVTIPEPPPTDIVVKDPLQPVRQATVTVGSLPDWSRAARQGVHQISGRSTPIVITDVRPSRTGTMTVVTATRDDITRLWWILESGRTLLVQWPKAWGEDDVYVQVGDVTASRIIRWAAQEDRTWSLPLVEVDRPVGGLAGSATRTWDTVETESVDWLDVLTTYASWLAVYSGEAG